MTARSCRVTVQNGNGVSHTADVTAASVYEAVAQGLAAFRKCDWADGAFAVHGTVTVSVAEVRVEHQIRIADFTKWLERPGPNTAQGQRASSDSLDTRFTDIGRTIDLKSAESQWVDSVSKKRQKTETRCADAQSAYFDWVG